MHRRSRRTWLAAAAALVALPRAGLAQSPRKTYRIGILRGVTPDNVRVWDGFFADLRQFGYVEGVNLAIELREYENVTTDAARLAAELAGLRVDVIVTGASPAPDIARRATSTIPIVMTTHPDPVEAGLASSLARPGGNVTGLSNRQKDLRGKQLELLKEVVPALRRVAVLMDRDIPSHQRDFKEVQAAGESLKVEVFAAQAGSASDFAGAFASIARERAGGAIPLGGAIFFAFRRELVEQAARSRMPSIYPAREFAEAGGLISYGPSLQETYRRAAWYVDRVLKGTSPRDLAIEQPSQFELVVNMPAARALGFALPSSVLARAERIG